MTFLRNICLLSSFLLLVFPSRAATQSPQPKSYSASIKTGQIQSQNAMRVEGAYRDTFNTKDWGLDFGHIWRIYIGAPIKFLWHDSLKDVQRVEVAIQEMSLTENGKLSAMVVRVNGKKEIRFSEASALKRTVLDITDLVVPGDNLLEISSKEGTDLLHGIQSVEVTYYPSISDRTPPRLTIIEPSIERGLRVARKGKVMTIRGRVADESGVYEVRVNDTEASVSATGEFYAEVLLGIGENPIRVRATDTKTNSSEISFTIVREPDASSNVSQQNEAAAGFNLGDYYALIIAVQDYRDPNVVDLDYPVQDAKRFKELISREYTFDDRHIILLENPDRTAIINSLDQLTQKVTEADSLLIFYAGHGYWDEKLRQGFWLPSNASKDSRSEWLSNSTVRDYLGGIRAKHILLIADACFSGSIFKTREAFINAPASIQELYKLPSRKAMTSGALKSVPDKSVFVEYLVKRLAENRESYLVAEELFSSMRTAIINNSPNRQTPQFGEIRETGDEGGDFIFARRSPLSRPAGSEPIDFPTAWQSDFGPVTLSFVRQLDGAIKVTGFWVQDADKRGLIKDGLLDLKTGLMKFYYYQSWNGTDGEATFRLVNQGKIKRLEGTWTQIDRATRTKSEGVWAMRNP